MTEGRVEAELKFWAADERPLEVLAAAPALGPATLGPPRTVEERDRYLDTADLRLSAARWACRLRTREGRTIVSLKGPAEHAPGDLLHRRREVEGPADVSPEPSAWPPSAARELLLQMTRGGALSERFSLEQQRTERSVSLDGRGAGTLSLDRVRMLHTGLEIGRLAVVELELDAGALEGGLDPAELAAALTAVPGLIADPTSKFERALALLPGG